MKVLKGGGPFGFKKKKNFSPKVFLINQKFVFGVRARCFFFFLAIFFPVGGKIKIRVGKGKKKSFKMAEPLNKFPPALKNHYPPRGKNFFLFWGGFLVPLFSCFKIMVLVFWPKVFLKKFFFNLKRVKRFFPKKFLIQKSLLSLKKILKNLG